jgi:hypothetical protein
VQRPLTSGAGGGRLTRFYIGSARGFVDTCLYDKGKAKAVAKGGGSHSTWPAGHMARLAGLHLVSYCLSQVSGAPPRPYKYPLRWKSEHTHHFGNFTCKAFILSVVARRSLVGRVVRL